MIKTEIGAKCIVKTKKGDYPSLYFGVFQYKQGDSETPVAIVKLKEGNLGMVSVGCVFFEPAPYIDDKMGKRIYLEE